jgi:hypothetical protein
MKKITLLIALCISFQAKCNIFEGCGEYQLRGQLEKDIKDKFKVKYVTMKNSKSETIFHLEDPKEMQKILPYLNQFTEIKVSLRKRMDGTRGLIQSIAFVKLSIPNPLNMNSDFLKLSSSDCEN